MQFHKIHSRPESVKLTIRESRRSIVVPVTNKGYKQKTESYIDGSAASYSAHY